MDLLFNSIKGHITQRWSKSRGSLNEAVAVAVAVAEAVAETVLASFQNSDPC